MYPLSPVTLEYFGIP